jgi:hypothetical protein
MELADLVHALTCRAILAGALGIALSVPPAPLAHACGFENPESIAGQRGILNLAFPKALYVASAVWRAKRANLVPTDTQSDVQRKLFGYRNAMLRMKRLAKRLDLSAGADDVPAFSVVLLTPMLWTRFDEGTDGILVQPHQTGPSSGDSVIVTDEAVIEALDKGMISAKTARDNGLLRFYGPDATLIAEIFDLIPTVDRNMPGVVGP